MLKRICLVSLGVDLSRKESRLFMVADGIVSDVRKGKADGL